MWMRLEQSLGHSLDTNKIYNYNPTHKHRICLLTMTDIFRFTDSCQIVVMINMATTTRRTRSRLHHHILQKWRIICWIGCVRNVTWWDGCRARHTVRCATKALTATLSSLLVALIDELRFAGRINAPKTALAGFVLRTSNFDKVANKRIGNELRYTIDKIFHTYRFRLRLCRIEFCHPLFDSLR